MGDAASTIAELLRTTSRTFALSIPLLPAPIDEEVTLAYLVFRIADTLEDSEYLDPSQRRTALHEFCRLLDDLSEGALNAWTNRWTGQRVSRNADYSRLLQATPVVLKALHDVETERRALIVAHAQRSASGMAEMLSGADPQGNLQLASWDELRQYCYYVAGIVGELITSLFVSDQPQLRQQPQLFSAAPTFGEGLQLVNILKDTAEDQRFGRVFIPANVARESVFDRAEDDLRVAASYVDALRAGHAPGGFVAFCDAPLQLATATLDVVRRHGPGAKVSRSDVFAILKDVIERAALQSTGR